MIGLRRIDAIDCSKLLSLDLDHLSWIPVFMVIAVVTNTSISWDQLEFSGLSYMVLAMMLSSFLFMLYLYIRQGSLSKFVAFTLLLVLIMLSSAIISANNIKSAFYDGCSLLFIAMACDYFKDRFKVIIISFAIAYSFCAYLNFVHTITHPELWIVTDLNITQGYLLGGNYNQMGSRLICAICTSILCLKYSKWWIINVIGVVIVSVVPLAVVGSMTSLTGIFIFLVFCLIPSKNIMKIGIFILIGIVIFFQIFVCFQGKGLENSPLAVYLIQDVLGKDLTFTYRTDMWEGARQLFFESPIFGYGLVDGDWYNIHLSSWAKGPHNMIWEILINGGVILLALFTYINFMVFSKLPSSSDKYTILIYACMGCLFLMMIMEVYPLLIIFSLLALAYYSYHTEWNPQRE